jgi:hypothetical protein
MGAERRALSEIEGSGSQCNDNDPLNNLSKLLDIPDDWVKINGDEYIRHRYYPDFVIKRDIERPDAEFDGKFPYKGAWATYVEYWYGSRLLKRSRFVFTDGGRYLIPLPKLHNPFSKENSWVHIRFSINTSSIERKTARLFRQYFPLDEILPRIGISIE